MLKRTYFFRNILFYQLCRFFIYYAGQLLIFCSEGHAHAPLSHPGECLECPYFISTEAEVTTSIGDPANLTCGVRNVDNWQVSWIRRKDLHVLTTGATLYTNDKRFRVHHINASPYWTLEFREPLVTDTGIYECQVSTQPKIYKRFIMEVTVPEAQITGGQEIFMKAGSDINITCVVSGHTQQVHVLWYHSVSNKHGTIEEEINHGGRGGVQMVTDRHAGTSWLLVKNARWKDGGNYTCAPVYATPAVVSVHITDEAPAAMQPDLLSLSNRPYAHVFAVIGGLWAAYVAGS